MTDYSALISSAAQQHGLRASLVAADIQHESRGDPFAIGDNGVALGLMQVHPGACETVGKSWGAIKAAIDAKDEAQAAALGLDAGCAYLAFCIKTLGGDEAWGLAAYNQGPTTIGRAHAYAKAVLAGVA